MKFLLYISLAAFISYIVAERGHGGSAVGTLGDHVENHADHNGTTEHGFDTTTHHNHSSVNHTQDGNQSEESFENTSDSSSEEDFSAHFFHFGGKSGSDSSEEHSKNEPSFGGRLHIGGKHYGYFAKLFPGLIAKKVLKGDNIKVTLGHDTKVSLKQGGKHGKNGKKHHGSYDSEESKSLETSVEHFGSHQHNHEIDNINDHVESHGISGSTHGHRAALTSPSARPVQGIQQGNQNSVPTGVNNIFRPQSASGTQQLPPLTNIQNNMPNGGGAQFQPFPFPGRPTTGGSGFPGSPMTGASFPFPGTGSGTTGGFPFSGTGGSTTGGFPFSGTGSGTTGGFPFSGSPTTGAGGAQIQPVPLPNTPNTGASGGVQTQPFPLGNPSNSGVGGIPNQSPTVPTGSGSISTPGTGNQGRPILPNMPGNSQPQALNNIPTTLGGFNTQIQPAQGNQNFPSSMPNFSGQSLFTPNANNGIPPNFNGQGRPSLPSGQFGASSFTQAGISPNQAMPNFNFNQRSAHSEPVPDEKPHF